MTQPKTLVPRACVPVYKTVAHCPNPAPATVLGDARSSVQRSSEQFAYEADLRSPADCYHSEAYLVGWLVKLYGWRVLEPGTLRRGWNPREVAAAGPLAGVAGPGGRELQPSDQLSSGHVKAEANAREVA